MKGLSKGLKYISQFFDNEKEQEIQIGAPTDVKHVAHIGNNGPFNNAPSWMNEFHMSPESMSAAPTRNGENKVDPSSEPPTKKDNDSVKPSDKDSLSREIGEVQKPTSAASDGPDRHNSTKTKQSKRQSNDSTSSLAGENSEGTKPRRHKSSNSDPSIRDSSDRPRRNKNSGSVGSDSLTQDPNGPTRKNHRRKKTKSGDSTRSTRSKESSESINEHIGNIDLGSINEHFGHIDLGSEFELKDSEMERNEGNSEKEIDKNSLSDEISSELRAL